MVYKKRLILRAAIDSEFQMKMIIQLSAVLCLVLAGLTLSSCASGANQPTAAPTDAPPTRTPFPTFAFVEPTKAPVFDQTGGDSSEAEGGTGATVELDPKLVERGRGRFDALECGNCHGAQGEGTEQAKGLLDFAMTEEDFVTFMRSGGELGTRHQFSTDRLSDSGSRNLYQFLVSIAQVN